MTIIISNASPDPIYKQIIQQIRSQIMQGDLSAGDALPSIRALARDLQVSVITTKRAYDELESEGFIDSVTGKGSFVSAQNTHILREMQLRSIEERLAETLEIAASYGLGKDVVMEIIDLLYQKEEI